MNYRDVLYAKVNTFIGSLFVLSFGIYVLTIGFKLANMEDPIANAIVAQVAQQQ